MLRVWSDRKTKGVSERDCTHRRCTLQTAVSKNTPCGHGSLTHWMKRKRRFRRRPVKRPNCGIWSAFGLFNQMLQLPQLLPPKIFLAALQTGQHLNQALCVVGSDLSIRGIPASDGLRGKIKCRFGQVFLLIKGIVERLGSSKFSYSWVKLAYGTFSRDMMSSVTLFLQLENGCANDAIMFKVPPFPYHSAIGSIPR
jgi:hypothetical protein